MTEPRQIKLQIDSCLDHVAMVGLSINNLCSLVPLTKVESYRIELATVEVITNCIRHAYKNQSGFMVEIEFSLFKDKIIIDIYDSGIQMESSLNPVLNFDPKDTKTIPEGGMGIFLIHKIMDEIEVTRQEKRNRWRLIKYLKRRHKSDI